MLKDFYVLHALHESTASAIALLIERSAEAVKRLKHELVVNSLSAIELELRHQVMEREGRQHECLIN